MSQPKKYKGARPSISSAISQFGNEESLSTDSKSEDFSSDSPSKKTFLIMTPSSTNNISDDDDDSDDPNHLSMSSFTHQSCERLAEINQLLEEKKISTEEKIRAQVNRKLSKNLESLRLIKKDPLAMTLLQKRFYTSKYVNTFDIHRKKDIGLFNHHNSLKIMRKYNEHMITTTLLSSENEIFCSVNICDNVLDGQSLYSNYNGQICLIDIESKKPSRIYDIRNSFRHAANHLKSKNTMFFAGFTDGTLKMFDTRAKDYIDIFGVDTNTNSRVKDSKINDFNPITNIEILENNQFYSSCTNKMTLWDIKMKKPIYNVEVPKDAFLSKSVFFFEKNTCASIDPSNEQLTLWNMETSKVIKNVNLKGKPVDILKYPSLNELAILTIPKTKEKELQHSIIEVLSWKSQDFEQTDVLHLGELYLQMKMAEDGSCLWMLSMIYF